MAILIDLHQVMIANIAQTLNSNKNLVMDRELIKHMILNSIRSYAVKFRNRFGKIIICCDGYNYWRKKQFPFYKAGRKKLRDASPFDWTLIFNTINETKNDLKEHFPYKVLDIEGCEADDIIAGLVRPTLSSDPTVIVSSDKDFAQLKIHSHVSQYSPLHAKFIEEADPEMFLKEHILRGDRGDGIPNFLSPDSCFMTGERQKSINIKKLQVWLTQEPIEFCDDAIKLHGYARNRMLIDFTQIPKDIIEKISNEFYRAGGNNREKMLNYFIAHRMKHLVEVINEF